MSSPHLLPQACPTGAPRETAATGARYVIRGRSLCKRQHHDLDLEIRTVAQRKAHPRVDKSEPFIERERASVRGGHAEAQRRVPRRAGPVDDGFDDLAGDAGPTGLGL